MRDRQTDRQRKERLGCVRDTNVSNNFQTTLNNETCMKM